MPFSEDSEEQEIRNAIAVERTIAEINEKRELRVRVLGTVLSKQGSGMILDDGTDTINVNLWPEQLDKIKEKQIVCIIGRVYQDKEGKAEIRAEVVQDASSLNLDAWRKVQKAWRERFKE